MADEPPSDPWAASEMTDSSKVSTNDPKPIATLTDIEVEVILYIEQFHATMGVAPNDNQIRQRFSNIKQWQLDIFKSNPLVLKSMAVRGIPYPHASDVFTQRQMAAAATMLDYKDRRSDSKKLSDIGVSTREWSGWLQDNQFAAYLRDRSERMLEGSLHEAHLGLIKGIRNGNTASIDKFYRMTGRYNPDQENQINMRLMLHQFIEVIQRHVKDPATMHAIAAELSTIATTNTIAGNVQKGIER